MLGTRPDVLVLGGGGVLGEAWMNGVLAGIEATTGFDLRECEQFVGTSAGSIVAANLVAGRSPKRPAATGTELARAAAGGELASPGAVRRAAASAGAAALQAAAPLVRLGLTAATPGGAVLRALLLAGIPTGRQSLQNLEARIDASGARFDGRLRIVAVDRRRGRRVVFGRPGSPRATVGEAVAASCSVPWLFAPVPIGGREYVDGGVWSATNLDVATAGRDTHVLCLAPIAGLRGRRGAAGAGGFARSAIAVEALLLRRRGARVQAVSPDAAAGAAMGANFMDPGPREQVLEAGYRQGLELAGKRG